MRPLEPAGYNPPAAHSPGPAPSLLWIRIDQLVVDESYQRKITKAGRDAVQRIVDGFDWAMFSPVIVAPVEGGRYAIVDGQHRCTAAAVCGVESVPCQVVQADRQGQARAFAAVNGNVVKITSMQLYRAAREAGEDWAVKVADVCSAAGVTVLRYPMKASSPHRPRHSTMAVRPIQEMINRHGRDHAIRVLTCITGTELGDDPGVLGILWMNAISAVLAERPEIPNRDPRLLAFFNDLDAGATMLAARNASQGVGLTEALAIRLRAKLSAVFDRKDAAA